MKTNSTIRGIAHGHMTKDNLTGFASMMTSDARTLSLARIAMNLRFILIWERSRLMNIHESLNCPQRIVVCLACPISMAVSGLDEA